MRVDFSRLFPGIFPAVARLFPGIFPRASRHFPAMKWLISRQLGVLEGVFYIWRGGCGRILMDGMEFMDFMDFMDLIDGDGAGFGTGEVVRVVGGVHRFLFLTGGGRRSVGRKGACGPVFFGEPR